MRRIPGFRRLRRSIGSLWRKPNRRFVLLYHRVATLKNDPWELAVTPEHFREHLEVLRRRRRPIVSLGMLASGIPPKNAVAISFDDGYWDNLTAAAPILESLGHPATFFIATGCIGREREFWWDELERIVFTPETLPEFLSVTLPNGVKQWPTSGRLGEDRNSIYFAMWEALRDFPEPERQEALDQLLEQTALPREPRASHRTLSRTDLVALARHPTMDFGAHTVTHPVLAGLPRNVQRHQLEQSKGFLEELLEKAVTQVSYPHGRHDEVTVSVVRELGFSRAYTTEAAPLTPDSDPFRLPRVTVGDWTAEEFDRRLENHFQIAA